ncbi:MAG: putative lipid II flippase FtsW, partial [Bacillota bacterium]
MSREENRQQGKPDYLIIFVVLTLLTTGLIMIVSASSVRSYNVYGDSFYFFKHQLVWAILGIILMFVLMNLDYHLYQKYARVILLITIVSLILVLVPGIGRMAGGSRRWITLGPMQLQPSEIGKIGVVIYLAGFFAGKKEKKYSFYRGVLPPLIVMGIIFGLIIMEPDLGTAVSLAGIFFIIMFVSGVRLLHLAGLTLLSLPVVGYFIMSENYRRQRLLAFLNPWSDPLDSGYHIIQSLLALGSGGIFGVGLGNSRQKFLYLPEPGTDFIFAVLGEELGLVGTAFIVGLYFVLAWRGIKISLSVPDDFGSILAIGLTMMVVIQAIVNIGVVTASLPI